MSRSLSLHGRALLVCGALAAGAIVLNGLGIAFVEMQRADIVREGQRLDGLTQQGGALGRAISDEMHALDDYVRTNDPEDLAQYYDSAVTEGRIALAMGGAARALVGVTQSLGSVDAATDAWRATIAEPAIRSATGGSAVVAPRADVAANMRIPVERALTTLDDQLSRVRDALRQQDEWLTTMRLSGAVVQMVLGAALTLAAVYVIRRVGRSLARDAEQSDVINRFTESTAFVQDDAVLASTNLQALGLLVHPDASVVHILNRSQDRAVPEASMGDAIAEVLSLNSLARCPGIYRGSTYLTLDAGEPLSVHCPVYPVATGTLACVPLISGDSIGAVHLYWKRPHALPLPMLPDVNRIAQHAALAIGNRRLLAALQGQASTDARTGLPNSRAFDLALESELASLDSGGSLAVLMLDLDHFKDFNDRHGHPAGDEALRVFGGVLRTCVRDNDMAARYGGEEFTVLLRGLDLAAALVVAERIRSRTESTLIPLSPGISDRITISIGVAMAPEQGVDRTALLRAADEALYRAKDAGRNRVSSLADHVQPTLVPPAVAA